MARYLSRADLSHIAGKYIDQYYARFVISKDDQNPLTLNGSQVLFLG
jgi:hypothetical protein